MEGDYQFLYQQVSQEWLEKHTNFRLILSESTLWRWQRIAREQNIADNSALATFLVQHYDATRNSLMQTPFCTSCGSPLGQLCHNCFSLDLKQLPQVSGCETVVSTGCDPSQAASQVDPALCSDAAGQAESHHRTENGSGRTKGVIESETEAADENFDDNNAVDYKDDTDDEYYIREKAAEGHEVKFVSEKITGMELEKEGNSKPNRELETFTCEICSQIFFDPDQLVMHSQTHSDHMIHECNQCRARFFQPDTLRLHQDIHSQQKKHPCDLCSASFAREDKLAKHVALIHTAKPQKRGKLLTSSMSKTSLSHVDKENSETKKSGMWSQVQEKCTFNQEPKQPTLQGSSGQQRIASETCQTELRKAKTGGTQFSCLQCGREFVQKHHLERHSLTHTGEKRYGCQQCGAAFTQLSSLVVHMHNHYSHKPFLCGNCHKSFTTFSYLTKHVCKGSRTEQQCLFCGETFRTYHQLTQHSCPKPEEANATKSEHFGVRDQALDSAGENQKFNPEKQTKKGRDTRTVNLKENTKRPRGRPRKKGTNDGKNRVKCTGGKTAADSQLPSNDMQTGEETHPHYCKFCGARFMFLNHLTHHLQNHTGENAFRCSLCSESFRSMARLSNHLRTHSATKEFPCQYCGKILKSLYTLKEHLRSHTGEKPFKCDICGSCFTLSSTYKAHLRTHTGDRPYLCPHCGKSFVRSSNLSVHIRACTGDRPYTCGECGKSFSDVGYYKKHVNNHAGIRPYKCEYCGKAFSQSTSLKLHIRIHTGEKPYKCSQCHMAFAIPNSLTEHMRKHTGDKPYKCSICGKGFAKSCNRLVHFRTHNKNGLAPVQQPASGAVDGIPIPPLSTQ